MQIPANFLSYLFASYSLFCQVTVFFFLSCYCKSPGPCRNELLEEEKSMEEVPGAKQLCISYSTGQIRLRWPPAQACPMPTLPPVLSPRAALAEGRQRLWSLCRQHGCCSLPFPSPHLTITPRPRAVGMTRLCCRSRDCRKQIKNTSRWEGRGLRCLPRCSPVLFTPARSAP